MTKKSLTATAYAKKNPQRAKQIKKTVKRGVKQYAETFRKLANT